MDIFTVYIATFFIFFLLLPVIYFCLRFIVGIIASKCGYPAPPRRETTSSANSRRRARRARRARTQSRYIQDRQGNIYTISDDQSLSPGAHRYADFFYLEPTSEEAARIRAQLEKDDKDLPSYEDVMRISNLTAAAEAANAQQAPPIVVPPYSELDPNPIPTVVVALAAPAPPPAGRSNISATESATSTASTAPSTSRAAAAATATVSVAMPTAEHSSV